MVGSVRGNEFSRKIKKKFLFLVRDFVWVSWRKCVCECLCFHWLSIYEWRKFTSNTSHGWSDHLYRCLMNLQRSWRSLFETHGNLTRKSWKRVHPTSIRKNRPHLKLSMSTKTESRSIRSSHELGFRNNWHRQSLRSLTARKRSQRLLVNLSDTYSRYGLNVHRTTTAEFSRSTGSLGYPTPLRLFFLQ